LQPGKGNIRKPTFEGDSGKKAMKVRAPIVIRGAVSPTARDKPMMTPVKMLPIE
jgi:hypothetical protein